MLVTINTALVDQEITVHIYGDFKGTMVNKLIHHILLSCYRVGLGRSDFVILVILRVILIRTFSFTRRSAVMMVGAIISWPGAVMVARGKGVGFATVLVSVHISRYYACSFPVRPRLVEIPSITTVPAVITTLH
jgi:hypothetical protein